MKIALGSDHGGYELKERIKAYLDSKRDRKSTRLNSSHPTTSRMPSSA